MITIVSEWTSSLLMAYQHIIGYSVPRKGGHEESKYVSKNIIK